MTIVVISTADLSDHLYLIVINLKVKQNSRKKNANEYVESVLF